ncbi:MAG: DUF1553 domain-containing protein [Gemmataceae bacterium]|nr:DUF1553 domain-containing protein [Gemmataceae bacterium]
MSWDAPCHAHVGLRWFLAVGLLCVFTRPLQAAEPPTAPASPKTSEAKVESKPHAGLTPTTPTHWSLRPLNSTLPPEVPDAPPEWRQHPIDRFIWQKLAEQGLKPNQPADARAFIRRATFDLLGLPPTPEEVDQFERECLVENGGRSKQVAPRAVDRLIDRLLHSPHYGERWGRHWLDLIRFGESRGYERNEIITNLWPFRDYVIRSLNEDKPFDQFIIEHLAGDVIGKDQPDVEIGSAFLVAGPYDDVGNQDPVAAAQIRADQIDEVIRATSEAFLGLTMGCARCHNHKFDPLTQRDYYALYATFAGTFHGSREVATAEARQQREARWKPLNDQRNRLLGERGQLFAQLDERARQKGGDVSRYWVRPPHSRHGTEEVFEPHLARYVRLRVEVDDQHAAEGGRFQIDEFEVWTDEPNPRNVALASAGATARGTSRQPKDFAEAYSPGLTIDGRFGERWISAGSDRELLITLREPIRIHRVVFSSDRPKALGEDSPITSFVGEYRIETSLDGETWRVVATSDDRQPKNELLRQRRLRNFVMTKAERVRLAEIQTALARLDQEIAAVPPLPLWWVGTHRPISEPQHVYLGGNPQRRGNAVVPSSPAVFDYLPSRYSLDSSADEGARRLALARWLTADDNPLTARVLANRVWHYHFGRGLVDTPSDFGKMGSRPTHPELLDWLAQQLRSNGWRLKALHRLIMTSRSYQQSSAWRADAARLDADSRYLWRFPPRRMTAEEIRDTMLSVAGKLDRRQGGPGFRLYDYQQDNVATYVPLDHHGPETYRRAVYHHHARSARVDVLTDFDCPDPAFAEPRRAATTTPLQALTMLNHSFAVDMARAFAERLQSEAAQPDEQVRRGFALAFSRAPSPEEARAAAELIARHGLRAFSRALLNANEFIMID